MESIVIISIVIIGFVVGLFVFGLLMNKKKLAAAYEKAQAESKKILDEARKEADKLVRTALHEAKEESRRRRKTFEEEQKKRKAEVQKFEKKLRQKEQTLEKKLASVESREQQTEALEQQLIREEKRKLQTIAEYELAVERNQKTLEKIANMSPEEARRELMIALEEDAKKAARESVRQIEAETRKVAAQRATDIISLAVQRLAGEYVNDSTITVVNLPSEEMKGRIIGREGRNIRTIEQATGVDLIIDDTPEAVILSCFNPVRREIARATLERLIADGRIHPARIEETVKRVESEFDSITLDYGEQAAFDIGITDLHPEVLSMLGKLKFRHAGTQSVLQHSVETARICGMMASELKMNVKRAKRAGLLHDIGKAVDQEIEGHHADVSADICAKYGENPEVVEAVRMHHAEDLLKAPAMAVIVGAANTLSSNRPGARNEVLEGYIRRLEDIEKVVHEFPGIEHVHVLQAGREVRALVIPDGVSDQEVRDLSDDIALKIRQELTFPGQVRITVLRESKFVEMAT
ncbi:MAG: ribonuclease Y [Deltaproteobacteria bacterium]|nr:ribonuclease Y [Deltaproteobacteria bacterium]